MQNPKTCPIAAANPQIENSICLGEECACYIKVHKPRVIRTGNLRIVDPHYLLRYAGCGLITRIPFELVKREENTKNPA